MRARARAWVAVVVHGGGEQRGEGVEGPEHLTQPRAAQEVLLRGRVRARVRVRVRVRVRASR